MRRRPDTELIVLARQGSDEAVEALFDRYWPHAWRAAYYRCSGRRRVVLVEDLSATSAAARASVSPLLGSGR